MPEKIKQPSRPYKLFAIEHGTVIDHIPAGRALTLVKVLKLPKHKHIVTVGLNFKSKAHKVKDIIKVEEKELTPEEINQVAILVPTATINIIRDFEVAEKYQASMPESIEKLITCPNPKCITNNEATHTKFYPLEEKKNTYSYQCHYCERIFSEDEIISEINNN